MELYASESFMLRCRVNRMQEEMLELKQNTEGHFGIKRQPVTANHHSIAVCAYAVL